MDLILAVFLLGLLSIGFLVLGQRLKIPSTVCFLLIGILAGPYALGIVTDQPTIEAIGEIGVILLLFAIGLEFSFEELFRSWRIVVIGGTLQVCTTIAAASALMYYAGGFSFNEAVFFGFLVSLSSTAIVMKILQERGDVESVPARVLLGILIFQDLAIIPMILITPFLIGAGGPSYGSLPLQVAKVIAIIVILIASARWGVPWLLYRVAKLRSNELFIFTVGGICFAVAWLTSIAGLSYSLGAFVAGLIISESDFRIDAFARIIPFRDVFAAIFFVSIGMLLDPRVITSHAGIVLILLVVILGVKVLTGSLTGGLLGMPVRVSVFVGLALAQIGEFSFVLAQAGLETGLVGIGPYQVFLAGAIITMALTPFTMNAAPRLTELVERVLPRWLKRAGVPVDTGKGVEISDHIVIVGFGMTGMSVARAAGIAGIPYRAIDLDPDVIRKERQAGFGGYIFFGDPTHPEVLDHAGIRRALAIVVVISEQSAIPRIVHLAREMAPGIYIIVRTRHVSDVQPMLDLGADEVIPEEFEATVRIFSRVLARYTLPEPEIEALARTIRSGGYRMFTRASSEVPGTIEDMRETFGDHRIYAVPVPEGSIVLGKAPGELKAWETFRVRILGIRRGTETITMLPPEMLIQAGDHLILYATPASHEAFRRFVAGEGA